MIKNFVKASLVVALSLTCALVSAQEGKIAPQTAKVNTKNYPAYSWDTVPVCIHLSKGNGTEDFTQSEIDFMAQFPLICIEKNQAYKKHGSMEQGTLVAAAALKKANPKTTVLFYNNSRIDYGMFYRHGVILGDDKHPEWALKNLKGEYITVKQNRRTYDPSNKEFRDWWHKGIIEITKDKNIGGLFIDALPQYVGNMAAKYKDCGKEKYDNVVAGVYSMLDNLHEEMESNGKIMIANFLRGNPKAFEDMGTRFHNHTDGGMMEHFTNISGASKEQIARDIALIADAGKRGKICVVKGWPRYGLTHAKELSAMSQEQKVQMAKDDIVFPLACFLAGAGEHSYFCYSWGYRHDDGGLIDYPEYHKPLGKPLGDAKKKGWVYTRSFERAEIWVDIEKREAKINWK